MREPAFWYQRASLPAKLLAPLAALYGAVAARRLEKPGEGVGIPVICVGNYHVGGAGKTPTTIALMPLLRDLGETPVIVSRGYGGRLRGPVIVDPSRHGAADVGDEPLMMAQRLPVIVSRDRISGAEFARRHGATVVVLDDGFQNPALRKDLSLIVIDARRGIGNGKIFPAGPLRAPLAPQMQRTDALIVVGNGVAADGVMTEIAAHGGKVVRAHLFPVEASTGGLRGRRVLALAGIGDPQRFFATLRDNGVEVVETRAFPDHHPYSRDDIRKVMEAAIRQSLVVVTTEKDMVRLRSDRALAEYAEQVSSFPVMLGIADEDGLKELLARRLREARAVRS